MTTIRKQTGSSLVSVIMSLGCVVIMASALFSFTTNSRKITKSLFRTNVRDKIQNTMKIVTRLPTAIRLSLDKPGNGALQTCLLPLVVFDPSIKGDCISGALQPINLYGPMVSTGGGLVSLSGMLAGGPPSPVEYNLLGAAIDPGSSDQVAFTITSWFRPYCPPKIFSKKPEKVCDLAEIIEFIYEIEPKNSDPNKFIKPLKTIRESVVYSVMELSNRLPAVNPIVIPIPPPIVAPPVVPPTGEIPPVPPPPILCIGDTIQIGPNLCACPPGQKLYRPSKGLCRRIGL